MLNEKVKKKEEEKKNQANKAATAKSPIEVKIAGTKVNGTKTTETKAAGAKTTTANAARKISALPAPSSSLKAGRTTGNGLRTATNAQKAYSWNDYIDDIRGRNTDRDARSRILAGPVNPNLKAWRENTPDTRAGQTDKNTGTANINAKDDKEKSFLGKYAEQLHEDYYTAPANRATMSLDDMMPDYLGLKSVGEGGKWAGKIRGEDENIMRATSPVATWQNSNAFLENEGAYDDGNDYTMWSRGKLQEYIDNTDKALQMIQAMLDGSPEERAWADQQIKADEDLMNTLNNGLEFPDRNGSGQWETIRGGKPKDYDTSDETRQTEYDAIIYNAVYGNDAYQQGVMSERGDLTLANAENLWSILGSKESAAEKFKKIRGYDDSYIQSVKSGSQETDLRKTVEALEMERDERARYLDALNGYYSGLEDYQTWAEGRPAGSLDNTGYAPENDRYKAEGREDTQDVDAIWSFINGGNAWNETYAKVVLNQIAGGKADASEIFEGYDYGYYVPSQMLNVLNGYYAAAQQEEAAGNLEAAKENYDAFRAVWEATKPMRQNQFDRQQKNWWAYTSDELPITTSLVTPVATAAGIVSGPLAAFLNSAGADPKATMELLTLPEWEQYARNNITQNLTGEVTRLTGSEFLGQFAGITAGAGFNVMDQALMRGIAGLFAGLNEIGNVENFVQHLKAIDLGLMSTSAFTNDYVQMYRETGDNAYATAHAVMSAMLELSTETWLSADALFNTDTYGLEYFKNVVLGEGAEEVTGAVLEPFMDTALENFYYGYIKGQGPQPSAWEQDAMSLYRNDPDKYTREDGVMDWGACLRDAMALYGMNILESGLGGAMGAVGDAAIGAHQITGQYSSAGKYISENNEANVRTLAEIGQGMLNSPEAQKLGRQIMETIDNGKKVANKAVGRLYELIQNGTSTEMAETIRNAMETAGIDLEATKQQLDEELAPLNARQRALENMLERQNETAKNAVDSAGSKMASGKQMEAAGIGKNTSVNQKRGLIVYETADPGTGNVSTGSGTIVRKQGDNYIIRDTHGEEHAVDINEARAADDVTAAVMKYAETTAAEDELATGMLQAAQGEGITKENVGRVLQDAQDMFTRGILDRVTKTADMLKIVQNNLRMDPGAAEALYKAGSQAAQTWEENRVKQAAERGSTLNPGNGKVTYGEGVNLDELSGTQKTRVDALSTIAQKVGFNVEFINDTENKARYGEYNPATGSVTINLAGESGTGIAHHLMVTAGHELTHLLESQSGNGYAELRSYIFAEMQKNGLDIAARVQEKMDNYNHQIAEMRKRGENHADITLSEAMAEVVADACDQVLGNEKIIQQMAEEHPSLYQKVKNFVKDFIQKVKAATVGMEESRSSDSRWIRDMDTLREKWGIALEEVGENTRNTENIGEQDNAEAEPKFSFKYTINESWESQYEKLNTKDQKKWKPSDSIVFSPKTTSIYQEAGFDENYPLTMTLKGFRKATRTSATSTQSAHGIDVARFKNANKSISEPYFILTEPSRNSVIAFTDITNNGKPVAIPIVKGNVHDNEISNEAISAFELRDAEEYISNIMEKDPDAKLIENKNNAAVSIRSADTITTAHGLLQRYYGNINENGGNGNSQSGQNSMSLAEEIDSLTEENGRTERTAEESVLFSLRELENGTKVAVEDRNILEDKPEGMKLSEFIRGYISGHIGEMAIVDATSDPVYLGTDLPNEFTNSQYTRDLMSGNRKKLAIKNRMAGMLLDMIRAADNKSGPEKIRHQNGKAAARGVYRFTTHVAFPIINKSGQTAGYNAYTAQLIVNHSGNGKMELYDVIDIKKDDATAELLRRGRPNQGRQLYGDATDESINTVEDKRNGKSGQNQWSLAEADAKYMQATQNGDEERAAELMEQAAEEQFRNSKIRDEDGKLIVVYHGTDSDFTVFDINRGRANMDIQGAFFSPWEMEAGDYGESIGKYYLNIQNPATESEAYKAFERFKGQNEAGRKAREYLIDLGYDGVNNDGDEYIAFYPEQIKSAEPITYDDNGDVIPLSERFNNENQDIRYSFDEGAPDANDWIMGLDPKDMTGDSLSFLNTKGTRELIRNYQKLNGEIQETRQKMADMKTQLKEARGDEARKLRINLQTEKNKLERLEGRMNDITEKKEFGWLMQRAQETIDTFLRGKTQAEVDKSVEKMKQEAKRMRTIAADASESLERLAEREENVIARSMLDSRRLGELAAEIKANNGNYGDLQMIEDGIGEVAIKLLAGDGEGMMESTNKLIDRLLEANWASIRFNMMGGQRFEASDIQGEMRLWMQENILSAAADAELLKAAAGEGGDAARVNTLIDYVNRIASNTMQTSKGMDKVAQMAADLQKLGDQVSEASAKMRGELKSAIRYFDMVNEKNRAEATAQQIEEVIRTLESKAAKRLIQEQEKWNQRIETDKRVRQQSEENRALRRKINTAYTRVAKLILNETDLRNATEEMKPIARAAIRMILDNDVNKGKKITGVDYQTLLRSKSTMDALDRRDGTELHIESIEDLYGERDADLQDAIRQALDNIRQGIDAYNGDGRGRGVSVLEADQTALEQIQQGMSAIYDIVSRSGQIFLDGKRISTANMAYEVDSEARNREAYREWEGPLGKAARGARNLWLKNMTPEYFFKNMKNNGITQIYDEFKRAEDRYGKLLREAKDKVEAVAEKAGYSTWDTGAKTEITLESGKKVRLTLEQMMSLYATWNREQQLGPEMSEHLMKGGFVFEEKSDVKLIGREAREQKPTRVTQRDMLQIEGSLTEAQREYVNSMVDILSKDMADIGNETSMRMYGIKKYNEGYYFPFAVWDGVKNKGSNAGGGVNPTNNNRAAHYSFTNRRVSGANNAVYLMDFTRVCAEHINQMTTYATMAGAIENMNRVLNFRVAEDATNPETATERNVESILRQQYGQDTVNYIREFMKDLNGGAVQENGGLSNTLMSVFKKNAVGGSLSVALQQPLSYIRASTMIDVKYLAAAGAKSDINLVNAKYWKGSYQEMLEHSGVAVIKDMGRFDMNFSQGAVDWISPDQKESGIRKVYNKIEEATNALPEKMDQYTWVKMWNALKMEQHDLHPEMDVKSDAFLDMVGERFNDVMRKTQVYDSVLVKSQMMRNQSWYAKSITAFRAEPTLSLNLFMDAFQNVKEKGGKKNLAAVISTFLLSAIAQAAVKGIMSAGRSPDEKKTLAENFAYRFGYSFIGEANPLSLIPGYDNIVSLLGGSSINDNALDMVKTFADSLAKIWNPPTGEEATIMDGYRYIEDTVGQITQMFTGVPAKNLMRDSRAIYNWFLAPYANRDRQETDKKTGEVKTIPGRASSASVIKYQTRDLITSEDLIGLINGRIGNAIWDKGTNAYYDRIYQAEKTGDEQAAQEMRDYLTLGKGITEDNMKSQIAGRAKKDESLTAAERADWLLDNEYMDKTSWITTEFKAGEISEEEMRELYARYFPEKNPDSALWSYWQTEWKNGEISESEAQEKYRKYNPGKTESQMLGYFWNQYADQYKEGEITESEAMKLYRKYHPDKDEQSVLDYFWKDKWQSYKEGKITESEAMKLYDQYHPQATEKQKNTAFWQLLKDDYTEGKTDRATAEKAYRKYYPGAKEDDIWWVFDELDYKKETGKTASGQYYRVHDAIETNRSEEITKAVQLVMKHGKKKNGVLSSIEGKWKDTYLAMRDGSPEKVRLKDAMIKALKAAGYSASAAEKAINGWKPDKDK